MPALPPGTGSESMLEIQRVSEAELVDIEDPHERSEEAVDMPGCVTDVGWGHEDVQQKSSLKNTQCSEKDQHRVEIELQRLCTTEDESLKVKNAPLSERKRMKRSITDNKWDVFLSYRAAQDKETVENIYWRLNGMEVVENGITRKLRVFWDKGACPVLLQCFYARSQHG